MASDISKHQNLLESLFLVQICTLGLKWPWFAFQQVTLWLRGWGSWTVCSWKSPVCQLPGRTVACSIKPKLPATCSGTLCSWTSPLPTPTSAPLLWPAMRNSDFLSPMPSCQSVSWISFLPEWLLQGPAPKPLLTKPSKTLHPVPSWHLTVPLSPHGAPSNWVGHENINVTLVTLHIVEDLMRVRLTRCAGRPGPTRTAKGPKSLTWRHGASGGPGEVPHPWRPVRAQGTEVSGGRDRCLSRLMGALREAHAITF